MAYPDNVLAEARSWLATPYHHGADIKGAGVDCAMLLVRVFHDCGLIPAIDPRPYPSDWHFHRSDERYLSWVLQFAEEVAEPQPGDIVTYLFGRCFSHGGIVVQWPQIIHASMPDGMVVYGEGDAGKLAERQRKFWRIKER